MVLAAHADAHLLIGQNSRLVLQSAAAAFVLFSLLQLELSGYLISGGKWLRLFGDASYSIYLIHFPLISLLCKISIKYELVGKGLIFDIANFISQGLICLAVGVTLYLVIEKPSIKVFRKWLLTGP